MTVGAVVTEINGQPIYADKVLQSLDNVFSAEAKQRDERSFRAFAETEIRNQVYRFVNDELIYAQAENVLDKQEKDFAEQITERWREQQKTLAGGSIQAARAKFAAEGIDFDEALKEKYRQNMTAIYIEKKIRPKVQVTASDMRMYYDKHVGKEFSEPDSVQYRLITISVSKSGSKEAALKRINDIYARVQKGEDFQSLATQYNDDARLARNEGLESPIQRGALRDEKLADAVFSTQPGQLTGIIESGNFFYLAKIESAKGGRTQPFDDPEVQRTIKDALTKEQMEPMLEKERMKRLENGVMVPNPPLFDPVIEMAMQKYPQWASSAGK
jgi:parvulin-like peptidyl-prolyl isomerase